MKGDGGCRGVRISADSMAGELVKRVDVSRDKVLCFCKSDSPFEGYFFMLCRSTRGRIFHSWLMNSVARSCNFGPLHALTPLVHQLDCIHSFARVQLVFQHIAAPMPPRYILISAALTIRADMARAMFPGCGGRKAEMFLARGEETWTKPKSRKILIVGWLV